MQENFIQDFILLCPTLLLVNLITAIKWLDVIIGSSALTNLLLAFKRMPSLLEV